jgi:hypothetical protein
MYTIGFDSTALRKEISALEDFIPPSPHTNADGTEVIPPSFLKGLLGVSVTTEDPQFSQEYMKVVADVMSKEGLTHSKLMYKGAQLLKVAEEKTEEIICKIVQDLEPFINFVDIYSAFYQKEYISILGQAQGQRLSPLAYINKTQNSFAHVCAWWYWKSCRVHDESKYSYHIDHFQGKVTPAWRDFSKTKPNLSVYYSGNECEALISLSDLILKLIELYHFGPIDFRSVVRPLEKRCLTLSAHKKIRSHDVAKYDWMIRTTVPDSPLEISLNSFVKHPVYFVAWSPLQPRTTVKPSFEYSILYNNIMKEAIKKTGCVKFLDFSKDMVFWNETDFIIPINKTDIEHVESLKQFGYERMPQVVSLGSTLDK